MALGFEQAGFDVLASVDADPVHLAAHERNFPLCEPVCGDISEIGANELVEAARRGWNRRYPRAPFAEPIDCIFGGPSCQGFSVIGPRRQDDPRNALVAQFARLVVEMRPRWLVMENVPGLVSPAYRPTLDAFYQTLRAAGYQVAEPWTLNARDHGVPQVRKRVFVVGAYEGEPLPIEPPAQPNPPTVAEALGDLPALARFRTLRERDALILRDDQFASMLRRQSGYVRRLNGLERDRDDLADQRDWDARLLTSVGVASHSDAVVARLRRLRLGERDEVGRLPKLDPRGLSPTLRAGTGRDHGSFTSARPIHYSSPRVIAVREAARLHGFPDWFGFHATKWHGFRQVGNAVPPPLARAVARAVVEAARVDPPRRTGEPLSLGSAALLGMTMGEAAERYGLDPKSLPVNVRALAARKTGKAA
ncbi:dcm: DNA (cytosine-5-)-methyltransferase [Gaiella occulta]|uniref:DNA (cytosine-5-)-methyltransferase n=2 Tax=Gaiella occulta TaxID=1002870 RepID=A0A7M2YVV1_9ACTN|nr:dcm: DNA (cytosine-5-)-methyltransferase [Gaiella occulta]